MTEEFSLKELQFRLGVPQHILIHLCEKGVIEPEVTDTAGRGKWRKFSRRNLFEFVVALELRKYEIPVSNVRVVVRLLRVFEKAAHKSMKDFALPDSLGGSGPDMTLYLNDGETLVFGLGRKVYLAFNLTKIINGNAEQTKPQKLASLPNEYRSQLTINLSKLARDIAE